MFIDTTRSEQLQNILRKIQKTTNINQLTPASFIYMLAKGFSEYGLDIIDTLNQISFDALLPNATGTYLDLLGKAAYIERKTSSTASVSVSEQVIKFSAGGKTFGEINNGNQISIPAFTEVYTDADPDTGKEIMFLTTEIVILAPDETEHYVGVEASGPGEIAIGVGAIKHHNFTAYDDIQNESLLVTNVEPVSGGTWLEDDDSYRYRIANRLYITQGGNDIAIISAAMTSPGVADVRIVRHQRGIGTFDLIVMPVVAGNMDSIIREVKSRVRNFVSSGEDVVVEQPSLLGVEVGVSLVFAEGTPVATKELERAKVIAEVTRRINNRPIGGLLTRQMIVDMVFDAAPSIVRTGTGNQMFDNLFLYTPSYDGNRVRNTLVKDIYPEPYQKVVTEFSIEAPVVVR